jgi:hypothetical protein
MTSTSRSQLVALTLAGFGVAVAGTAFCIVQTYRTAQLPEGDGTGMQWVILTPLTMLFLFIVVPAFATGIRGLRLIKRVPKPVAHLPATPSAPRAHPARTKQRDRRKPDLTRRAGAVGREVRGKRSRVRAG